jgi:thiosulfate/3-mercaptopyruvate sulfurtransferase
MEGEHAMTSALIQPEELHALIARDGVRVLDASYNLPPAAEGVPGAVDFDIDDIADPDAPLAHTIPSAELFGAKVGALGIGNGDLVVVYDRSGIAMAASRAWWMFRLFGHDNVRILDGGLPAWVRGGYATAPKAMRPAAKTFTPKFRPHLVKFMTDVRDNLTKQDFTVLDARDARRYAGEAPEPRPGMTSGHIPQSLSAPYMTLLDPATGRMRPRAELEKTLRVGDGAMKKPLACSCGSGVTACVVALGLFELGRDDVAVYDGSWTEWGSDPSLPKNTGMNP